MSIAQEKKREGYLKSNNKLSFPSQIVCRHYSTKTTTKILRQMDINRILRPRRKYFAKGCLIGLAIVSIYCLFDNPYLISLLFSQNEQVINQVANQSQSTLDITFNLFRTIIMFALQYVLFKNFQLYFFLCLKHDGNSENLNTFELKRIDGNGLNINQDFLNFGIFMIAFTASIPLIIIKIVEIWGGFISTI